MYQSEKIKRPQLQLNQHPGEAVSSYSIFETLLNDLDFKNLGRLRAAAVVFLFLLFGVVARLPCLGLKKEVISTATGCFDSAFSSASSISSHSLRVQKRKVETQVRISHANLKLFDTLLLHRKILTKEFAITYHSTGTASFNNMVFVVPHENLTKVGKPNNLSTLSAIHFFVVGSLGYPLPVCA